MKDVSVLLGKAGPFLNRHWFKLGLVLLLLYTVLSRDLSFNVSVHNPGEVPEQVAPPSQQTSTHRRETLTESQPVSYQQKTNLFDFWPSWGNDEPMLIEALQRMAIPDIERYIERFGHVAQAETEKFGIPASIILASGLLQGQAGQAPWVKEGQNFFAIPCTDDWDSGTQDGPGGCLRRYDNAWMSFRDHSLFLRNGPHRRLRKLRSNDYREWADALASTIGERQEDYDAQLRTVIEKFGLVRYDQ